MKNNSTPKDEIIECSCGECYKKSYHGVVCPNCAKVNKPVVESTPSEGWAKEIRSIVVNSFADTSKNWRVDFTCKVKAGESSDPISPIETIVSRVSDFLSQEIAKARQEARQECAEKIKNMTIETVGNSAKTVDQIIKELEE